MKSNRTKQIIIEQVNYLADEVIKSSIHISRNCDYIIIPEFPFPANWHSIPGIVNGKAQVLIHFPNDYPLAPPIGFYIDAKVESSPNGHLFTTAMHGAPMEYAESKYWKWYCAYIRPGGWQPTAYTHPESWLDGDNLYTFYVAMHTVMTSKEDSDE